VVIVCEHAINTIPPEFGDLGLDPAARQSHIAWDPGALGVAHEMRRLLNADLVAGSVSRLLCDCNRPPEAPSAMPEMSEIFKIPGNWNLTERDRQRRTTAIYKPFYAALKDILDAHGEEGVLITVHSFTPVFKGVPRVCEIGILHDVDARLADAMFAATPSDFPFSGRGGTGRRAGLKIRFRKECRFDSDRPHQSGLRSVAPKLREAKQPTTLAITIIGRVRLRTLAVAGNQRPFHVRVRHARF
jgi:hypothetical protein